jgi:hypothetical protein
VNQPAAVQHPATAAARVSNARTNVPHNTIQDSTLPRRVASAELAVEHRPAALRNDQDVTRFGD